MGSKGEAQEHPFPCLSAKAWCLQDRAGDANPSSRPPCPEGLKGSRTLGERRGRSVSYLQHWASEEGQWETESNPPTRQPGGRATVLAQLPWRGSQGGPGVRVESSSSTWCPGSGAGARRAPFPWGSVSVGKGGSAPISFTLLETELRKHQAWGLRVPCRLDKPQRWIWQPGQWKGNLPWVLDRSEGHRGRLPVGAARPAPASRGHSL